MFKLDLATLRDQGDVSFTLFLTARIMRRKMLCSVAPNESLNSLMKAMASRSRNMSDALRNSRMLIKAFINKHERFSGCYTGNSNQVRSLRAMGNALVDTCMDIGATPGDQKAAMQAITESRAAPLPLLDVSSHQRVNPGDATNGARAPSGSSTVTQTPAYKFELVWRAQALPLVKTWKSMSVTVETMGRGRSKRSLATYMCMEHFGYRSWFAVAKTTEDTHVEMSLPIQRVKAASAFASAWDDLVAGKAQIVTSPLEMYSYTCGIPFGKPIKLKVTPKRARKTTARATESTPPGPAGEAAPPVSAPTIRDATLEEHLELIVDQADADAGGEVSLADLADIQVTEDRADEDDGCGEFDMLLEPDDLKQVDECKIHEAELVKSSLASGGVSHAAVEANARQLSKECACKHMDDIELEHEAVLNDASVLGHLRPKPVPDVSERVESLHRVWLENARQGIVVLQEREIAVRTKKLGHVGQLALVETDPGQLAFIDWTCPTEMTGRVIDVDAEWGVKAVVCVGAKRYPKVYRDCSVVHPAIGTTMRRIKPDKPAHKKDLWCGVAAARPTIPESIRRLKHMWETASGNALAADKCNFCLEEHQADLNLCALCGMTYHPNCVALVSDAMVVTPEPFADWPPLFASKSLP